MTSSEKERLEILEMIQNGTINPQEGIKLIEAFDESQEAFDEEYLFAKNELADGFGSGDPVSDPAEIEGEDLYKWKAWWILPFWIGVTTTVLGGALLYRVWTVRGLGFGFVAAWIPFLIGVGLLVLGWNSRTGPWIHLRIQQKPGETPERIAFSFPIPNRFFAWCLRTFGSFFSKTNLSGAEEILLALGNYSPGDSPLSVDVEEGENGEKVKIYIG